MSIEDEDSGRTHLADRQLGKLMQSQPNSTYLGGKRLAVSAGQGRRAPRTIFQIDIRAQVHLCRDSLEDKTPLSTRRQRELDLSVESSRTQQGRVERVLSIRRHDDLHVS